MKNLDLNAFGVSEMNQQEMLSIDGGNIFKAIANAVVSAVETAAEAVAEAAVWVYDNILSKPASISF